MQQTQRDMKESLSVLIVNIGDQNYAVKAATIEEIVPMMHIQKFPQAIPFLEGFVSIRGGLFCIVDLRKRFGGSREHYLISNRILLVRCQHRKLGFIVDHVSKMEEWQAEDYLSDVLSENPGKFTEEVGLSASGDIHVLNLCRILTEEERARIAEEEL
ncbi:MAG: chemotaxis protein CheW [SAR324 cluster bacterium]|nr:chemotaxis protein CheW [SAR324 cluster bacterium]